MGLRLYLDVHVRREITNGLRLRGVDVLTAQEDGADEMPDSDLLDRATTVGRALFSQDSDLLAEATARQRAGHGFAGVVFARQTGVTIGQCVDELELIAKVYEPAEMADRVEFLPLK